MWSSNPGMGQIWPMGWIQAIKGCYLVWSGSFSSAQHSPQAHSGAGVVQWPNSASQQPWRWQFLLAALASVTTVASPSPADWAIRSPCTHHRESLMHGWVWSP